MTLEEHFDPTFATALALREKQIQQNYRPIIGIHKWFARRPGTLFRSLLLAELNGAEPLGTSYWHSHKLRGVVADPFMGGGTPVFEANRLGLHVVGTDINPMAWWVVQQSLASLDLKKCSVAASAVIKQIEQQLQELYQTACVKCGQPAQVKYFLWVKTETCPICGTSNPLFPGYLLAENKRHPKHVLVCGECGALNEYDMQPTLKRPEPCNECGHAIFVEGPARRQRIRCRSCACVYPYPAKTNPSPPVHIMWALEYHCQSCKPTHAGRFFKQPDAEDLARFQRAEELLNQAEDLPIPDDAIPDGDETDRLHRWGYRRYREMFNARQLLGLGLLLKEIRSLEDRESRDALLTVFSDFLRYQNMLCRYDTYALKCQDIFSVHGFPVGLVQCENNLLGIAGVGSGSFRHFVEKYLRAKRYCEAPFETRQRAHKKQVIYITGEKIRARFVDQFPTGDEPQAYIQAAPATKVNLPPQSLDAVFTDPPYFDNVQYAELIDFCFVWLRLALRDEVPEFRKTTTRAPEELTGNLTLGRGLPHFTDGLSAVFRQYAAALKPNAPFVFTYHHNDPKAYVPLVVAILDAGLDCTASIPAAAEMSASLHIAGTASSVLDSVFVCRQGNPQHSSAPLGAMLNQDVAAMTAAGLRPSMGDIRCLAAGHVARIAINRLHRTWETDLSLTQRMRRAQDCLALVATELNLEQLIDGLGDPLQHHELPGSTRFATAV